MGETDKKKEWKVILEPLAENPDDAGRNMSGVVLYIEDETGVRKEHSRVAYMRRNAKNPEVPFKRQLRSSLEQVVEVVEMLRTQEDAVQVATAKRDEERRALDAQVDEAAAARDAAAAIPTVAGAA